MRFSILYCRSVDYNIIPVPGRAKISRFLHLMNVKYTNTHINVLRDNIIIICVCQTNKKGLDKKKNHVSMSYIMYQRCFI